MVNGVGQLLLRPFRFLVEIGDARFQFRDREAIEVLPCQQGQGIVTRATRKIVVVVHGLNVDPQGGAVNKLLVQERVRKGSVFWPTSTSRRT